jgi:hypothetical protein
MMTWYFQLVKMSSGVKFVCYNMHGFNNGNPALNDLCDFADVIAVEEHWLAPYNM